MPMGGSRAVVYTHNQSKLEQILDRYQNVILNIQSQRGFRRAQLLEVLKDVTPRVYHFECRSRVQGDFKVNAGSQKLPPHFYIKALLIDRRGRR